jgi:acetylornithine/succinyldiaminopimelate/putrescine aminotransferase
VVALTVLRAVQRQKLQAHAHEASVGELLVQHCAIKSKTSPAPIPFLASFAQVGEYLLAGLRRLASQFPQRLGDVRGQGLMVGLECVRDASSKAPAPALAAWIKRAAKVCGGCWAFVLCGQRVPALLIPTQLGRKYHDHAHRCPGRSTTASCCPPMGRTTT